MQLDDFLKERTPALTAAAFAERIGVSEGSLSRIRQGKQNITLQLAARIVEETEGKVTLDDLATALAA